MSRGSIRRWSLRLGVLLLTLAAPTVAVGADGPPVDVAVGYSFLRLIPSEGDGTNMPAGWVAAVGGQLSGFLGLVSQVSGNYKTETFFGTDVREEVHAFGAGPRIASPSGPTRGYGQVLFGASNLSASGGGESESETDFTIEPCVGVDVAATNGVGLRLGANLLLIRAKSGPSTHSWEKAAQVIVAIVFRR